MTLDPHKQFSEKNHTLVQQMYEGLLRFDPEGRMEPALALSWERRGPLRMRFRLRPGVRFHNGEPFDAEAVRFSIARYLDPKTGFPAPGFVSSLDRAEVVDPLTVDIVTKFPDGLLLNRLAGFILMVPPRHVRRGGDRALEDAPVGTGPFRFERWTRGREISMTRNASYWEPRFPRVERLVFKFLPVEEQLRALSSGEIDLSTELPGTRTTEAMRSGLRVIKAPTFYTVTGSLDATRPPLSDRRVRRALNHAVNKEELVRYDLRGNGRPIATVTMPGEEGHNASLRPYAYDPALARALLAEAGYPAGFALRALVKAQGERAARILADQLAKVGVRLELKLTTDAAMIEELAKAEWDVFIADCPDPMAHSYFIQSIFLHGRSPYSLAADPAYDAKLEEVMGTLDGDSRRALAEELDAYMHREALLLFLYQRVKTYGVSAGVSFRPAVTGMPYFFDVAKEGT